MATAKLETYDNIDRPYNSSMQRSVFSAATENVPGTTQEESGRTIKTGEALTDVWIDTWIKSRTYQPKTQGFLLDSKGGYIECMDFSIGTGIDMFGNDAYFYDYTEATPGVPHGTYIKTQTASLNFTRKFYEDQNFIIQKRVGYDSPSAALSDNVMEFFYENQPQTGRRNYIFFGTKGDHTSVGQETNAVSRFYAGDLFQFSTKVNWGLMDYSILTGGAFPVGDPQAFAIDSTRHYFVYKNNSSTAFWDPVTSAIPGVWQAGAFIITLFSPATQTYPMLIIDEGGIWVGNDIFPMADLGLSLGKEDYRFKKIYAGLFYSDATHALGFAAGDWWFSGSGRVRGVFQANTYYFNSSVFIQLFGSRIETSIEFYSYGSISCAGDLISAGNVQSLGGVVRVGSTNFTAQTITYKNGSGVNTTGTFLMA